MQFIVNLANFPIIARIFFIPRQKYFLFMTTICFVLYALVKPIFNSLYTTSEQVLIFKSMNTYETTMNTFSSDDNTIMCIQYRCKSTLSDATKWQFAYFFYNPLNIDNK